MAKLGNVDSNFMLNFEVKMFALFERLETRLAVCELKRSAIRVYECDRRRRHIYANRRPIDAIIIL